MATSRWLSAATFAAAALPLFTAYAEAPHETIGTPTAR
jgi:hypothetical protein